MRIISFITDYAVVDRIINHLKLTFVAERPPPPHMV
ncbi:MAG: acid--CoA ligase [Candidatus Aminicenantes bacterium]|nr:acid--CoA ligase [Candidatus Aminicenantes bacterium]